MVDRCRDACRIGGAARVDGDRRAVPASARVRFCLFCVCMLRELDHKERWSQLTLVPPTTTHTHNSATKKQGGSTNNRGNQLPKMLGVKLFGGARAGAGAIIVRQRGTRVHAGEGVGMVSFFYKNRSISR